MSKTDPSPGPTLAALPSSLEGEFHAACAAAGHGRGQRLAWALLAAALAALAALGAGGTGTAASLMVWACALLSLALCAQGVQAHQTRCALQRLAVLAEVTRLSNPRFGADATLVRALESLRAHFDAQSCQLVLRSPDGTPAWLYSAHAASGAPGLQPEQLQAPAAARLLPFPPSLQLRHVGPRVGGLRPARTTQRSGPQGPWRRAAPAQAAEAAALAHLLEARSFISLPVALPQGSGRLYLCSERTLHAADADFLAVLTRHALAGVEQVALLDRLASSAAARERRKWALDLHDSAIQPYIGLRMGLGALRQRAADGQPVADGLAQLEALTDRVLKDLRRQAQAGRQGPAAPVQEPLLHSELRQEAAKARALYGLDIALQLPSGLSLGDRLSAELLQLVREGLANMGRHASARRGEVRLAQRDGWLDLCMANEAAPCSAADFHPRSLSERAAFLGGRTQVQHDPRGGTAVHIHIPL